MARLAANAARRRREAIDLKPSAREIAAFALRVFLWGAFVFAAWYFAARPISTGVAWVAAHAAELMGPVDRVSARIDKRDAIFDAQPAGEAVLRLRLPVGMAIEVAVNPLKHTFGIPFFLALLLASRPAGLAWKAPLGVLVIGVLAGFGMAFDLLVQLRNAATPQGALLFPFGAAAREAIAVGYQLGVLILPTLVPVVLWAAMDRGMALRAMARGNASP